MSSESKNQARWRKLERVVLSFDGLVIFVSVAVVLCLALLALIDQVARFRNVHALIAGISFALLAGSFVPPYLGMRRRIRWRWILHLLPLLTLLVLGPLIQQLMPSTRFGHVNKFYRNGSAGMEPTLLNGEFIGARLLQEHENIQRGDIVLFKRPTKPPTIWVKRVIGVPGDVLRMKNYQLYLNDQLVDDTFYGRLLDGTIFRDNRVITVPEGSFFLMGDNRDESIDSRTVGWGPIARDDIIGLVGNKD